MELILFDRDRGQIGHLKLKPRRLWAAAFALALAFFTGAFFVGWHAADAYGLTNPAVEMQAWRAELEAQQALLEKTRRGLQQSVDALALRLGQMKDRKSTRLNSSHVKISYAVFCLRKKNTSKQCVP